MFDYTDDIHFIGLQLDRYYGKRVWPWRLCAEAVGCSITTVRKYYEQDWKVTSEGQKIISQLFQKMKNAPKNELHFLTPQNFRFFLNGISMTLTKQKITENEKEHQEEIIKEQFELKYPQSDNYEMVWSNKGGLYLLAQIVCLPSKPSEKYYIIKVGKSTNLQQRIKSYKGMNPFAKCIDIKELAPRFIDDTEIKYHQSLDKKYNRQLGTEWFVVPKEDYIKIVKKGFDAL